MGFTLTAPTYSHHPILQSHSLFAAAFRSNPSFCYRPKPKPKRVRKRSPLIVHAQSENGALLTSQKPDDTTTYGRQYFPLAAVVGQVSPLSFFQLFRFSFVFGK